MLLFKTQKYGKVSGPNKEQSVIKLVLINVEDFYKNRSLLKVSILPEDIAEFTSLQVQNRKNQQEIL